MSKSCAGLEFRTVQGHFDYRVATGLKVSGLFRPLGLGFTVVPCGLPGPHENVS